MVLFPESREEDAAQRPTKESADRRDLGLIDPESRADGPSLCLSRQCSEMLARGVADFVLLCYQSYERYIASREHPCQIRMFQIDRRLPRPILSHLGPPRWLVEDGGCILSRCVQPQQAMISQAYGTTLAKSG